jgi:hypothetical protein
MTSRADSIRTPVRRAGRAVLGARSTGLLLCSGLLACAPTGKSSVPGDSAAHDLAKAVGAASVDAGIATRYPPGSQDTVRLWHFDDLPAGKAPEGFSSGSTGGGAPPQWRVLREADAPTSPHVVAQTDTSRTSDRFSLLIADLPRTADGVFSVRCKPISGRVDQACGIAFRVRDARNYYLVRANALEDNVRLYTVIDGRRRELASWSGRVSSGQWHELRVDVAGDQMRVSWDNAPVLEKRDATFPGEGQVGLWTKADSYTLFDNLVIGRIK